MLCPLCKTQMRITATRTTVTGDESPDTVTRVFIEQDLTCRNPACSQCGKVVEQVKTQIK